MEDVIFGGVGRGGGGLGIHEGVEPRFFPE